MALFLKKNPYFRTKKFLHGTFYIHSHQQCTISVFIIAELDRGLWTQTFRLTVYHPTRYTDYKNTQSTLTVRIHSIPQTTCQLRVYRMNSWNTRTYRTYMYTAGLGLFPPDFPPRTFPDDRTELFLFSSLIFSAQQLLRSLHSDDLWPHARGWCLVYGQGRQQRRRSSNKWTLGSLR